MLRRYEGDNVRLVVADYDTNWMLQVTQELNLHPQIKVVGFAQTGADLLQRIASMDADVILTEASLPDITAVELMQRLQKQGIDIKVFAVTRATSEGFVRTLKAAGIIQVYDKDEFPVKEVAEEIASYIDKERKSKVASIITPEEAPEPAKPITNEISQAVILTYNTKGGVGKSTVAANLAVAIKASPYLADEGVCLVDYDAGGANVVTNVHLTDADAANRNIAVWEYLPDDVSAKELENYLLDGPRGIKVAAAPVNQAVAEKISLELADKILRILKRYFKIIVIDGAPNISTLIDAALIHSTHILMITNPEGQSVRQLARIVKLLSPDPQNPTKPDMSHILRKMFLILNYAQNPTKWDLKPNEIAELVGKPIYAEIPYDDVVRRALHGTERKLAVELEPNGAFATAIKKLANNICSAYPGGELRTPKERKGILGRFFA